MRVSKKMRALGLLAGLAIVATACGDDGDGGGGTTDAKGIKGGTLIIKGAGDVDHLDTATAYYTVSYSLLRATSRQLVSYANTKDTVQRDTPVADLVEGTDKDWRSADGKTYKFKLKEGVKWGKPVNAPIVANDFLTGLKRLCDPNNPSGGLIYYTNTIVGMTEFCDGFAKVKAGDIAAAKAYVTGNQISGVKAVDERNIEITLKAPAGDFLYMLAMPFASPVPTDHVLKYIADSPDFRKNFVSSGPYNVESYQAEKSIKLARNDQWAESTDKLRKAWVDRIEVTQGSDEEPVQREIEIGTADLAFDLGPPTARLPGLKSNPLTKDRLVQNPDGCLGYIVFNLKRKPFDDLRVRQAVAYAVNKAAVSQVLGGRDLQAPTYNILTEPLVGYKPLELYKTPGDTGDIAKAKQLLTDAGHPNGINVTFLYRNRGKAPQIAQTHQAALKRAGITVVLKQVPPADFYTKHLSKLNSGTWDFAQPGWCPDWAGNAARTFFSPLLDGRGLTDGTTNYGQFHDAKFEADMDAAYAEPDLAKATGMFEALDKYAMDQAVWVPMTQGKVTNFYSKRLQNWIYFPFSHQADFTNVWIDDTKK